MKVEEWQIDKVIPYENNPRNNDDAVDSTANSIKEFGWQQPIVVDKGGVVIVGHTRLKAAEKLNLDKVPVTVANNLTDEQVKAYRLADNKTGELAEWDIDMLDGELNDILDIDMENFGFDITEATDDEVVDDEFDEDPPEKPKSKLGDVYQLGRHRLMCGDSTKLDDVGKLMNGNLADLLITDPPYNVGLNMDQSDEDTKIRNKRKDGLTIQNDKMADDDFYQFLLQAFKCASVSMKKGAAFYVWFASTESVNFFNAIRNNQLLIKQQLIWAKNTLAMGMQDYQWKHEPCIYGWKEGASHFWNSDRKQTTILEFNKPQKNPDHPTMKPIPLFDYQIKNSSKKNDIVLDLFGGSGTTLLACEQNERVAYLMEFDPRYVDVIIKRWEEFTGQKAERVAEAAVQS